MSDNMVNHEFGYWNWGMFAILNTMILSIGLAFNGLVWEEFAVLGIVLGMWVLHGYYLGRLIADKVTATPPTSDAGGIIW